MYIAEENCVYFCNPNEEGSRELFVTVHPTKDCALARMLNSDCLLYTSPSPRDS